MRKVVVLNPKGGSGKTTVATNLAAYYASRGIHPALMDLDRQGSSMRWLRKREGHAPAVHGIAAFDIPPTVTRSFALRIPHDVERVIVDTPAALSTHELITYTKDADRIVIPVLPSDIDIHAAARCVAALLLDAKIPRSDNRIAVVANRVKRNTLAFGALIRFLQTLRIPAVAVLRDSQQYVRASESGTGIFDARPALVQQDLDSWTPLIDWIEYGAVPETTELWPELAETP